MRHPIFIALAGIVALAGCDQRELLGTDMSDTAKQDMSSLKVSIYDRVEPVSGQPVPTFNMAAVEGSLGSENGCLVLNSADRAIALVFAQGSVRLDGASRVLIDGRSFSVSERVRVGGSSTGGSAVGAAEIPLECRQLERWFVAPGSIEAVVR